MSGRHRIADLVPVQRVGPQATKVEPGERYGRLVVIGGPLEHRTPGGDRKFYYPCRCDCGVERPVAHYSLRNGRTRSCGCYQRQRTSEACKTHGREPARLFRIWLGMRERCSYEKHVAHADYGGRGIRVCPEWESSYEAFRDWSLANGYRPGLTIDRFPDNDGGYGPGNCRWATNTEQSNNRRVNRNVTAFDETKTLAQWIADPRCRVRRGGLTRRLAAGWPAERAITEPPFQDVYAMPPAKESLAVCVLNRAWGADPAAIHALICHRVLCNQSLADDPTVVVDESDCGSGAFTLGTIGLLNGILEEMGLPKVAHRWADDVNDGSPRKLLGFQEYVSPSLVCDASDADVEDKAVRKAEAARKGPGRPAKGK